jgi:hypothetical protein
MKLKLSFAVAILLLSISGVCGSSEPEKDIRIVTTNAAILETTLRGLNLEHPEEDMKKNASHRDFRFLTVCGYTCYPPGISEVDYPLIKKYGVRYMEGTSDVIEGKEHGYLIRKAIEYSENYNRTLLKELKGRLP